MKHIIDKLIELNVDTSRFSERDLEKIKEYTSDPDIDFAVDFYKNLQSRKKEVAMVCEASRVEFLALLRNLVQVYNDMISLCTDNTNLFGSPKDEGSAQRILSGTVEILQKISKQASALEDNIATFYSCAQTASKTCVDHDNLLFELMLIKISTYISKASSEKVDNLSQQAAKSLEDLLRQTKSIHSSTAFFEDTLSEINRASDILVSKLDLSNDGKNIRVPATIDEARKIQHIVLNATNSDLFKKGL